jgi:Asp-tRNA(Asn)/Glu-tRNA(Gln) amidotransferase A subunit family amidase
LPGYRAAPDATSRAILNRSACELIEAMKRGELTSSNVVDVFARQALRAHARHNCLTEVFIHQARDQALHLDKLRSSRDEKKDDKPLGLLHGLPISLKVQLHSLHQRTNERITHHHHNRMV